MSYLPEYTGAFKKDYKRVVKRRYNIDLLKEAIEILLDTGTLPPKYSPHPLKGNLKEFMECHILPDWLLIWKFNQSDKIISFARTGSHSDLF
ncbi:MAG: type II toxin-antitoxin system YafQ family toxin [Bacteroidetes bacterium]|nr:MAG: type II toxin-antitoxin system YafQ family toxin [Bacteroidota bacterium]